MANVGRLLLAIIAVVPLHVWGEQPEDVNPWQETGFNFDLLSREFLNDARCLSRSEIFIGCIEALNYLVNSREVAQAYRLVSKRHDSVPDNVALAIGDLLFIPKEPLERDQNFIQEIRQAREEWRAWLNVWDQVYLKKDEFSLPFSRAFEFIREQLDPQREAMFAAKAANLILRNEFDPHTYFMPARQFEREMKSTGDEYMGIGVELRRHEEGMFVSRVLPGSPANAVGIRAGDVIVEIDGEKIDKERFDEQYVKLRGHAGSVVKITIKRGGEELVLYVQWAPLEAKHLIGEVLETRSGQKVGYIRLNSFVGAVFDTCIEFVTYLWEYQNAPDIHGTVVDLRGNLGGSLEMVTCMLDAFLPTDATVLTIQNPYTGQSLGKVRTLEPGILYAKPLAVLVNGGSASASEIFAGVVQDLALGYVVGTRTFGKGTMQGIRSTNISGVLVAETTGRFHLPSGRTNQLVGILPDFEASFTPEPTEEELFAEREEDLYRNPIPTAKTERTFYHPNLTAVRECLNDEGSNHEQYREYDDYALLVSQDVVLCEASVKHPDKRVRLK